MLTSATTIFPLPGIASIFTFDKTLCEVALGAASTAIFSSMIGSSVELAAILSSTFGVSILAVVTASALTAPGAPSATTI